MFYCWDSERQDKDVRVYMKVLYFGSFLTCFFIVNVLFLDIFIVGFVLPLLKACKNVSLTDASSYLPRAVVGFELRGRCMRDPP